MANSSQISGLHEYLGRIILQNGGIGPFADIFNFYEEPVWLLAMQVPHPRPKDYSCLYFAISNNNNNDSNGNEKS